MKERPILFSAPMVLALLDGSKTQTRRIASKAVRHPDLGNLYTPGALVLEREPQHVIDRACPYGQPGDRLWVRESFEAILPQDPTYNGGRPIDYDYRATYEHGARLGDMLGIKKRWKPSIHMPREASRLLLEITSVRVESLICISDQDCIAEGIKRRAEGWAWYTGREAKTSYTSQPRTSYRTLWESINGPDSWQENPWVWVVEFKRISDQRA